MFSCEYCGIFKITCFEEHLRTATSIKCYFDAINPEQFYFAQAPLLKFLFQNENIKIISKIVNLKKIHFPAGMYLLKVNNKNTRTRCEICSKLTIKIPEQTPSGIFIVNLEHISHHVLVFLLLTLGR